MSNFEGGPEAIVGRRINRIRAEAEAQSALIALRMRFFAAKLHVGMVDAEGVPVKPLSVSAETMTAMLAEREAAEAAATTFVEAQSASIADAVVEAEPEPVAASARPTLADAKARLAAKARANACQIVSRPVAPVARPAPAPKPERVPGEGEFYCNACPKRHVVAAKDAAVHSAAWLETHFKGRPPTFEDLVELAVCGQAARADRRLNWYPLLEVHDGIQKWVAEQAVIKAEREAADAEARAKASLTGVAAKVLAPKVRVTEVARCVASSKPSAPAKPRGEGRPQGWDALADWKAKR